MISKESILLYRLELKNLKIILSMMAGTLVLLAVSCSPYKYETVKGDPLETRIYTLDNGLIDFWQ